jgi:hypothetical protein
MHFSRQRLPLIKHKNKIEIITTQGISGFSSLVLLSFSESPTGFTATPIVPLLSGNYIFKHALDVVPPVFSVFLTVHFKIYTSSLFLISSFLIVPRPIIPIADFMNGSAAGSFLTLSDVSSSKS